MRVAVCTRPDHIELQEWPLPQTEAEQVLVRVKVCGVCGSDVAAWQGSGHKQYPYSPGHEFCGTIEQMGSEVMGLSLGERVVIDPNLGCGQCPFCEMGKPNLCDYLKSRPIKSNGGLGDYVALDYRMVHALPAQLDDDLAPFIEPLSCALHVAGCARVEPGEQVMVFGAGVMGRLVGLALRPSGARLVYVEPAQRRRAEIADLLGVEALAPAEVEPSGLVGRVDVAIDCSGSAHAVAQAIGALRKAGRLVLAGLVMQPEGAGISLMDITTRELEVTGVWLNPDTFETAIDLALESRDLLANLRTQTFGLEEIEHAFELAASPDAPKVLVRP